MNKKPEFSISICSRSTKKLIIDAYQEALSWNHEWLEPQHFFLGILKRLTPQLNNIFKINKIDPVRIEAKIKESFSKKPDRNISELPLSKRTMEMLTLASAEYFKKGQKKLEPEHILSILLAKRRLYLRKKTKRRS